MSPIKRFIQNIIFTSIFITIVISSILWIVHRDVALAFFLGSIVNIMLSNIVWRYYTRILTTRNSLIMIYILSILKRALIISVVLMIAVNQSNHLLSGLSAVGGTVLLPLVVVTMGYLYPEI